MIPEPAPLDTVEVHKLTTEALVMMIIFIPPYVGIKEDDEMANDDDKVYVEASLRSGIERELVRRGAILVMPPEPGFHRGCSEWTLKKEDRVELEDVWHTYDMLENFLHVIEDVSDEDRGIFPNPVPELLQLPE